MIYKLFIWAKQRWINHKVRNDLKVAREIDASSLVFPENNKTPDVSIIIPTYGQVIFTLQCLKSLLDSNIQCRYEIIIAEDASGDAEIPKLRDIRGITLIENPANLGFLRSCNAAAQHARGRHLFFLNNDTRVMPGAIDELVRLADSRPDAGLVGSKLIYPDGSLQEAGGIIWSDASGWNYGRLDWPYRPEYNYVREADYISGAAILVPRKVWDQLGGFDDAYAPAYYEDTDLAFRVREAGLKVLFQPTSVVVHYEGISHGTDLNSGGKAWQKVNRQKFAARWSETLQRDHYPDAQHVMRARDHAKNRKVLLVVDHYIPEPDRDAGSRSMMAIMEAALANGWIVKFWPHNLGYGSSYCRSLEQMGIEVVHGASSKLFRINDILDIKAVHEWRWALAFRTWLRRNGSEIDYVLVSRPLVAEALLGSVRRYTKARIAYYGHDLHFARLRMQAEKTNNPQLLDASLSMEALERGIWRQVDIVLYPSQDEANAVKAIAPDTNSHHIVPYAFNRFKHREQQPKTHILLFVAGFGHPPNVDAAIWLARDVLPLVTAQYPDLKLVLAGSRPQDSIVALAGPQIEVTGTISDGELVDCYARAQVAVVPLRFGAGVKPKVVEAMQMGVPLVTTSIGAQGLPGIGSVLPIVDEAEALAEAILHLLTNDEAALEQSRKQAVFAESMFSHDTINEGLRRAFEPG